MKNDIWAEMMSGQPYDATDPELLEALIVTRRALHRINAMDPGDPDEINANVAELLGECGPNFHINLPVHFDYGRNIHLGDQVFINFNLTVLDEALVTIGSRVFIGPNCNIYTACHPLEAAERAKGVEWSEPVTIGDDCWLGGNVTILPGVTIGDGCVIGAGSVVAKSIPPYSVAVGSPARVIKTLQHT